MYATIYPDRLTVHQGKTQSIYQAWESRLMREERRQNPVQLANLSKKKDDLNLSRASIRKIKDSVHLLYNLTTPRKIKITRNREIYNFRLAFVTLTLPSKQQHTDIQIKNVCLNNFLNIMRNRFGLKNYVWVAELQQNQNIHFHILWDIHINHNVVRYYWNQSLELLGYVSAYKSRFSKMPLSEYAALRKMPISKAAPIFARQCREKWSSPSTEQVKALHSQTAVASYLSKYITKKNATTDSARVATFGRSWGRSQSISKIKFITRWDWDNIKTKIKEFPCFTDSFVSRVYDYCTVYYFNFRKFSYQAKKWLQRHMLDLGKSFNYVQSQPLQL